MRLCVALFSKFIARCLRLRYRIRFEGKDILHDPKLKEGGILFLPNHPAEIDPVMMMTLLTPRFRLRPLVVDHFFYLKGAGIFMKLVRAIAIPNFETASNKWKEKRGEAALEQVASGLSDGENFLVYPSGHLRRSAKERIGGSSFAYNLLQKNPNAKVILVRIEGLWGSMFSRALTGSAPDFWTALSKGIKIILKNGIFFVPKRDITVTFSEHDTATLPPSKLALNRQLEIFYNNYNGEKEEPIKLVSYSRNREELPKVEIKAESEREDINSIPEPVKHVVTEKIAEIAKREMADIELTHDLSNDLGLDSLDIAGMVAFLDHKYAIEKSHPGDLQTVADLCFVAMGRKLSEDLDDVVDTSLTWPRTHDRPEVTLPMGATLHESFLRMCDRMGSLPACGDNQLGVITYKRMKKGALVLAQEIKKLKGDYIGVMLPASVAVHILVQAILLAKKTPVMLNWTTGARSIDFGCSLLDIDHIISSRRFLERAEGVDLGAQDGKLLMLEDMKGNLSLSSKLKGLFKSFLSPDVLLIMMKQGKGCADKPAVMLFTSGTENFPKAVPLSHSNILSDLRAGLSCIDLNKDDIMLGALPPFHSFGFSVTGLMPLVSGFRTFFSPDPTDSQALASAISQWGITMSCLAPSFYRNLFNVAEPDQLKSVRYFVTGAEKAPKELYDSVAALGEGHQVIEGYGITECAPIVTINRPKVPPKGVGQPLPGVELCTISPETDELLERGESGEVCIKGPNVFSGYYGKDVPNPFIEIDDELYYRSGDMGHIDETGHLIFEGRLKRFVKIGGEMLSLTALESELTKGIKEGGFLPPDDDRVPLALTPIEKSEGRPELILITIASIKREEVNKILQEAGFGRIAKVADVLKVDEIPITGTGKVHFKALNDIALEKTHA